MRTTVTLDADVEALIRQAMDRGRKGFKQVLNEAVRRGLAGQSDQERKPFVVQARAMGLRTGIDLARARDLDDELEIREFLRKTRSLEAGQE